LDNKIYNHNSKETEDIPEKIQILSKFANIINADKHKYRESGKVQKLVANHNAKQIRNILKQKRNDIKTGKNDTEKDE